MGRVTTKMLNGAEGLASGLSPERLEVRWPIAIQEISHDF
jgi:hypothetical protein